MNNLLTVDQDKCIKCGICASVCPSCIIALDDHGPKCVRDRGCMACGHCVAVCPTGALSNSRCPLEEQKLIPTETINSEMAYNFMRARRSIRNFKPQLVEEDKIRQLLDVARYAPTAANSQGMYYIVVSDEKLIRKIADATADWMELEMAAGSPRARYFNSVLKVYREQGNDIIARNSKQMIFALARRLNETGISNCEQSWAYVELYAPTLGLGTTICGFIQTCAQTGYEPLRELLKVPTKQIIVGAMMVGYPQYKYHRLVERQHLKVEFR